MNYELTGTMASKKKDLMVISEMASWKIVGFLAHRHRVGLLATGNFVIVSYVAWDKIGHIFF